MGPALILAVVALGALGAGVLIGRYYVPDDRHLRRNARHGRAYLRALSLVLSRDASAAIAELREVVEDNVDDPEPYFALGALFRSRGETERAIRVHQSLALRERGRKALRARALYELGLDFRAAGMPRRATRAMEEVLAEDEEHEGALRAVAALYEEQGRFGDAAGMLRRLAKLRGEPAAEREHHLRVAAAQASVAREDLDSARHWLDEARALPQGESAHYSVAAAELARARAQHEAEREHLVAALGAEPALALPLWPALLAAEHTLAQARLGAEPAEQDDSPQAEAPVRPEDAARARVDARLRVLAEAPGGELPARWAAAALWHDVPGVKAAAAAANLAQASAGAREQVAAARAALSAGDAAQIALRLEGLLAPEGPLGWAAGERWRCSSCGHSAPKFGWRCAGCRRWSTLRLDGGQQEPPSPPPRERRALERRADGSTAATLPAATLPSLLSGTELAETERKRSVLGRAGEWISARWSGTRGQTPP